MQWLGRCVPSIENACAFDAENVDDHRSPGPNRKLDDTQTIPENVSRDVPGSLDSQEPPAVRWLSRLLATDSLAH